MRSGLEPNWLGFPGLPGLLLICAEIMPDKAILDHKKTDLVYFDCYFLTFIDIFSKN